ncbi:SMP-30/gluconolactonase/LRE family protein [Roseobacter weihaiensis]|uniref:SMP-30/gluconolactonase/LRE family protein n=1 Tax=Roseobacter weihaiensis TaxID=2763262 RepID=UPI001D0B4241|nr:SMP-30/gluconolactonase/LRE family protein [Roseobacter sp. H9]
MMVCKLLQYIKYFAIAAIAGSALSADEAGFPEPVGDPSIILPGEQVELVWSGGCGTTEGVSSAPDGTIFFSEITFTFICGDPETKQLQAGNIWRHDPTTGETTLFRSPSGMSNGIKFDANGDMFYAMGADYGMRSIGKTDMKTGRSYIVAGLFNGRSLNAPNDLTIDEQGRVWFTDPRVMGHEDMEQPFRGVYRVDTDGTITRVIDSAGAPNGILVSPDQSTLYVANIDVGTFDFASVRADNMPLTVPPHNIWAFDINDDGSVGNRREFVSFFPQEGADGLIADVDGNLYVTSRGERKGVVVFAPDGTELAYISTGAVKPTNVGFGRGDDSNVLYITAGTNVYKVRVSKDGYQLPSPS